MDTYSVSKVNRLFWLGRYSERVLTMTQIMMKNYDTMIDGEGIGYRRICDALFIQDDYGSERAFVNRFLFDPNDSRGVAASVRRMLDNAMVLRETISSPTLAYVQMAQTAMEAAANSPAPCVNLQWIIDDMNAFRGSCEDSVSDSNLRNIIKTGVSVERLSLYLRLQYHMEAIGVETRRLLSRINRTHLCRNEEYFAALMQTAYDQQSESEPMNKSLIRYVEGLCEV
ncbi:MAG TPA: alpha-E domain-containing protein [Candidatus Limiplasma sp.]|nr:alpha-E domain-containing protein [Candidatus Limiplasma sp.]